jgi:hypothetical protein
VRAVGELGGVEVAFETDVGAGGDARQLRALVGARQAVTQGFYGNAV